MLLSIDKDILVNTIPSYILDDPGNYLPYTVFVNMIGQYFDNIWQSVFDASGLYLESIETVDEELIAEKILMDKKKSMLEQYKELSKKLIK